MAELKSYTCGKCGAVLSIDKLEGQLICPFCGNEFDLIDFHREDLIRQAEECLSRGAYDAAREKLDKVLESNPQDIEAIRGLILIAGKVHSSQKMSEPSNLARCDLDQVKQIVSSAKEKVSEEEGGYLDKLVRLFELSVERNNVKERKKEVLELESKRHKQERLQDKKAGCLVEATLVMLVLMFSFFSPLVFSTGPYKAQTTWFLCVPAGIIILGGYIFFVRKLTSTENLISIPESSYSLAQKIKDIEADYKRILDDVRTFEEGFKKNAVNAVPKTVRSEAKMAEHRMEEITGQIVCAKCGGVLKPNAAQELYECSSCGVSYGKYLFFGDLTANAVKAMGLGEFDEADQILSHKLAMNPKDYEALIGRFLCMGRWKTLIDIDLTDRLFLSCVRKMPDQMDVLEKSISKEDQPHFDDIRKLSDLLAEYAVRRDAFNKVREKYKSICGKTRNTYLTSKEAEDYERQKNELTEKKERLNDECQELRGRINEAMKVLIDADTSCVFFKSN